MNSPTASAEPLSRRDRDLLTIAARRRQQDKQAAIQPIPLAPDACRSIRVRAGLSLQDIATLIGCSAPAVHRWENAVRTPHGALGERYLVVLNALLDEEGSA